MSRHKKILGIKKFSTVRDASHRKKLSWEITKLRYLGNKCRIFFINKLYLSVCAMWDFPIIPPTD